MFCDSCGTYHSQNRKSPQVYGGKTPLHPTHAEEVASWSGCKVQHWHKRGVFFIKVAQVLLKSREREFGLSHYLQSTRFNRRKKKPRESSAHIWWYEFRGDG